MLFIAKGNVQLGQNKVDADGNIISHTGGTFSTDENGSCVAIGEVDEDAPELKLSIDSIYGDFAAAEYLGKILEKLNPQRQTNLPDFKGIFKTAFNSGIDFCDYCSSTNYCTDCIVNEWKEEEMRADR